MSVANPEYPAVPEYPTELGGHHAAKLAEAKKVFDAEVDNQEGWEELPTKDGVELSRKVDPDDTWAIPFVRGKCTVENATTEKVLAVIQLPGMRKIWDTRFEAGHMLARYSRMSYAFYTEMKGQGWLVWPRDIVGVCANYRSDEPNQEIIVIQTSVEEPELGPEVYGKTRAKLTVAGWRIKPVGNDVELTYVVLISLEGSIPTSMVAVICLEIPTCVGRVRDAYYSHGHPPYIHLTPSTPETSTVKFQTEAFTVEDPPLQWTGSLTGKTDSEIEVVYDHQRMYGGGVQWKVEGEAVEGGEGVAVEDDGKGALKVKVGKEADGKDFKIVVSPK